MMRSFIAFTFVAFSWGCAIEACTKPDPNHPQNDAERNYEAAINSCVDDAGSRAESRRCRDAVNRALGIVIKEAGR